MTDARSPRQLLKDMFRDMVIAKDASRIDDYYHPDFLLETNGERQDFAAFADGHRKVYPTAIAYAVRYDEESWVEGADRVAVRLWITTVRPGEAPVEFEIVLIATWLDGRIHRLWEATWPDWRQQRAFETYRS